MRHRSCKLCSTGVLIVNPDALPLRFSALTFHLKVNLSVCSMCLKKSSKPPCGGAPRGFLWMWLQHSYTTLGRNVQVGGKRAGSPPPLRAAWVRSVSQERLHHRGVDTEYLWGGKEETGTFPYHISTINLPIGPSEMGGERSSRASKIQACLIFSLSFNILPAKSKAESGNKYSTAQRPKEIGITKDTLSVKTAKEAPGADWGQLCHFKLWDTHGYTL